MRIKKRVVSWVLMLSLLVGAFQGVSFASAKENGRSFEGENYIVCVNEQSSWDGGSVAEVSVKNTGKTAIKNWIISASYQKGSIENMWNVDTKKTGDYSYKFYCKDYNRVISPGEEIYFGYQMTGADLEDLEQMSLSQKKRKSK